MEFESPLPHKFNPLKVAPVAAFIFEKKNSVNFMPTLNYRKPRIVRAKHGWYITYTYKVPEELKPIYKKNWKRFKIIRDMNRLKGDEREQFAQWLLAQVVDSLKNGYNPFYADFEHATKEQGVVEQPEVITAAKAFKLFLAAWGKRGLEDVSMSKYQKYITRLSAWLDVKKLLYEDVKKIETTHIEEFLNDSRNTYETSNREYNNSRGFLGTCFKYLLRQGIITISPMGGIDKLKAPSTKHRFYDEKSLKDITNALMSLDLCTYLAAQTVYYLCLRSEKELMHFRVGNIIWDRDQILLDAGSTKGKSAEYVPMDKHIKELFLNHGVDKYPPNYYVFGIKGKPSENHFGKYFFAKRFRKVRDAVGLDENFSLYGFKHTRVVHLKQDGVDDGSIMKLTRHKDFTSYAKYLKDIGIDANPERINKVSRKI